jgi:hypothetical protein
MPEAGGGTESARNAVDLRGYAPGPWTP